MKRIKIGIRHNLIYPIMTIIFSSFRGLDSIFIDKILGYKDQLILTFLLFLSEFFSGAFLYKYQEKFLSNKKSNILDNSNNSSIKKINANNNNRLRIHLLLFANSFFAFAQFSLTTYYFLKFGDLSQSLKERLKSILTFWSAFFCYFLLKMPIFKHQLFSLIITLICLLIIIILESYVDIALKKIDLFVYISIIILNFIRYLFSAILEVNQKYLLAYEFLNPFYILMIEGVYGIILTLIFGLAVENPFKIFQKNYLEHNHKITYYVICLILYFIFSGGRNIYRIITNDIFSPMAKALIECFFVPLLIIMYFIIEKDFKADQKGKQSLIYFMLNLILSIIIVVCSCIYNELFILYCYGLEYNTHKEISIRASRKTETIKLAETKKIEIKDGDNYYYYNYEEKE